MNTVVVPDPTRAERWTDAFLAHAPPRAVKLAARFVGRALPLGPDPAWRFDKHHEVREGGVVFRRAVWDRFHEGSLEGPVRYRWYDGIRLDLHLGNDLSKSLFVDRAFEPNEFAFLASILGPGMTFVDAGANEGVYALFAARRVGPRGTVLALEPSTRERERLLRNITLNRARNVIVDAHGVWDADVEATLAIAQDWHAGQNTIGDVVANPNVETAAQATVRLARLDRIVEEHGLERVDVIKLDVEGSEVRALAGARATIERFAPVLQIEVEETALARQGATTQDLAEAIAGLGYRTWVFDTGRLRPARPDDELRLNVVAAPVARDLAET